MTAVERIRQASLNNYNRQVQEIAEATGKTFKEAEILMEIENSIQIEHERLTLKQ